MHYTAALPPSPAIKLSLVSIFICLSYSEHTIKTVLSKDAIISFGFICAWVCLFVLLSVSLVSVSAALVARVINKEVLGDYTRFDIQVTDVFKRTRADRVRRRGDQLWVKNSDLTCRCPEIKMGG